MENNQQLVEKVISLLKQKRRNYEINNFLKTQNLTQEEIDEIKKEAQKRYDAHTSKIRRILWGVGAVAIFLIFYFLIPVSISNSAPAIFSFIGAALVAVFVVQAIADIKSEKEFKEVNENPQKSKYLPLALVGTLVVSLLVFYLNFNSQETNELKENGVQAKGVIVDGSSYRIKRTTHYEVEVEFKTKEGKKIKVKEDVLENEFNSMYIGRTVDLIYLKSDPYVIELLTSDDALKKFKGSEERNITFNDLTKLIDLKKDEIGETLNKISYGWEYDEERAGWYNERRDCFISVYENMFVRYIKMGMIYKGEEFLGGGKEFEKTGDEGGNIEYESDKYLIKIENNREGTTLFSIINVIKKE